MTKYSRVAAARRAWQVPGSGKIAEGHRNTVLRHCWRGVGMAIPGAVEVVQFYPVTYEYRF